MSLHLFHPESAAMAQAIAPMARAIVATPEAHANHPHLFGHAWAALKTARGQTVHQHRLRPAHQIVAAPAQAGAA